MRRFIPILFLFIAGITFGQPNIVALEYFIDTDPGVGMATTLTVTQGTSIEETFDISTIGLSEGTHIIGIRALDGLGEWSMREFRTFNIRAAGGIQNPDPPNPVEAIEYFIDDDPGVGNGTLLTNFPGTGLEVTFADILATSTLSEGYHILGTRARDTDGEWGMYERRVFVIRANGGIQVPDPPAQIVDMEYFIDDDPGQGNGTALTNFVGNSVNIDFSDIAEANSVTEGLHVICIRALDENGDWGMYEKRPFAVRQAEATGGGTTSQIVALEYYFGDEDPGYGSGVQVDVDPPLDSVLYDPLDLPTAADIPVGTNKVTFRAKNDIGQWGFPETREFEVIDDCLFPGAQFDVQLACAGQPVTFVDNSTNLQPDATYRWYLDGDETIDDTTVGNASFTYDNPGTYVVSLAIRQGTICLDSTSNVFTIKPLPAVVFSGAGSTTNQATTFEASTVNLDPAATWSWDFDSDGTPESTNPNTASYTYTADGSYTVTLTVSDGLGCEVTTTKSVTMVSGGGTAIPEANFLASNGCVGSSITFTDLSRNLPVGSTYSWDFDGDDLEDATIEGSTSHVYNAPGSFSAKLTIDLGGSTIEKTQVIEIGDIPEADFSTGEVCEGTTVDFTDLSIDAATTAVYMWDFNNDGIVDSNAKTDVSYLYPGAGNYIARLSISNGFGCVDEVVKQVTITQKPIPNFEWNTVCANEVILFNDLSSETSVGATYSWDFDGDGNEDSSVKGDVSFTYLSNGSYNASLTIDNLTGCSTTIALPIEIVDRPEVDLQIIAQCYGQESQMMDLSQKVNSTANYQWDFNSDGLTDDTTVGNTSFTYSSYDTYVVTLSVDNGGNCVASADAIVEFADAAKPDFSTNKLCEGEEVVFTNLSTDVNPAAIYSWDFDGDGLEDSAFPGSTANTYANAGTYNATLTIDNGGNCLAFKTIPLEVTPPPAVDLGLDEILCEAGTVILDAGSGYSNYSWPDGSGNQTYAADQIGEYIVEVQDAKGCFNTDTIAVKLLGPPRPAFEYRVNLSLDGITLQLANTSENYESILWDLDNGLEIIDSLVSITYTDFSFFDVSTYTVCLTAINACEEVQYCEDIFISPTQLLGSETDDVVVYPNPVRDELTVILNATESSVALMNVQGKIVWREKTFTNEINIPMSGMKQGAYILLIEDNDRFVYKRIIKE